jgi:membrane protease YdiL (CAAX protease family)
MFTSSIFGVILVYVWILEPLGVPLSLPVTLVGALAAWSTKRLGLTGFSVRAFLPACRMMTMFTVPAVFVLLALGAILGTLHDRPRFPASLGRLVVWGGAQQWVLQTVVLREVRRVASRQAAIIATALVFALVHLPNPLLMIVTFVGAVAWCACFDRYPNVLPLAVSHALGTLAMLYAFNDTITGRLRIGASYLRLVRPS